MEVEGDGVCVVVEVFFGELGAEFDDACDGGFGGGVGVVVWAAGAGFEGFVAALSVAADKGADPAVGDTEGFSGFCLGHAGGEEGFDDDTGFGCHVLTLDGTMFPHMVVGMGRKDVYGHVGTMSLFHTPYGVQN